MNIRMRRFAGEEGRLRRLSPADEGAVEDFLAHHPIDGVIARAALAHSGISWRSCYGIFGRRGVLRSFAWMQGTLVPLGFDQKGLAELAQVVRSSASCSSFVGPADQVLGLWEHLEAFFEHPRDIRPRQYSMVAPPGSSPEITSSGGGSACTPHLGDSVENNFESPEVPYIDDLVGELRVRPARPEEIELVFPASVAMFTEELGYDPTIYGSSYRHRAEGLVRAGHTFIATAPGADGGERVIFKADVGALAGGVAQLQGVWTAPDLRGRGICTAGISEVVRLIRESVAPVVSLYVNDYNEPAVRAYLTAGWRIVGEWATVLL